MLNLLSGSEVEAYIQRLDSQLGGMPGWQREEGRREMRQHLEALILAYRALGVLPAEAVEEALGQMGDPIQIGQRMHREWKLAVRQERRTQWAPVRYAANWLLGLSVVSLFVFIPLLARLGVVWRPTDHALIISTPLLAGALTAWKWPNNAVPAIFYAICRVMLFVTIIVFLVLFICSLITFVQEPSQPALSVGVIVRCMTDFIGRIGWLDSLPFLMWLSLWLLPGCASAYLVSVLKRRKWYAVRPADWKMACC